MMPTLWVRGGQMQDREGGAAKRGVWAEAAPRDLVVNILCEGGARTHRGRDPQNTHIDLQRGTLQRAQWEHTGGSPASPTLWA